MRLLPSKMFCLKSSAGSLACVPVRFWIPAGGSVPGDDLTQAPIQAVVGLHLTGALARQTPHGAVARITQTLRLLRPAVHHAAGELIARQEFTGVRLVGWGGAIATGTPSAPQRGSGSEEDRKQHLTWFYFQRPTVDLNVEPLGGGAAEVLEHAVDGLGDVIRHRLVQLHPAVDHHTAVPEVEDFQLLESGQIGLQIWQKLQESDDKSGSIFLASLRPFLF